MRAIKAYVCQEKNYVFADVLTPQKIIGSGNRKSTNYQKIYGPQIATFVEVPQI
jgi:hypothetical protein